MNKSFISKFSKDTLYFTISNYISNFFTAFRGIIVANILGPKLMGIWSGLFIIISYAESVNLGSVNTLTKEFPYYKGEGNILHMENLKNAVFTYTIFSTIFVSIIIFLISFMHQSSPYISWGLRTISVLVFLQLTYKYEFLLVRSDDNFILLSKITIAYAVLDFVFSVLLTKYFSIYGRYGSSLIPFLFLIMWVISFANYRPKLYLNLKLIFHIIRVGIPLMIINFVYVAIRSIDKIMILIFLNVMQLGFYSIAITFINFILVLPTVLGFVMFPKIAEKFGEKKNVAELWNYFFYPTKIISFLMPIILSFTIVNIPWIVKLLTPKYLPAINTIIILLSGAYFFSIMFVAGNFLISIGKQLHILYWQIVTLLISFILDYTFLKIGWGINGVAMGTSITFFVYGFGIIMITVNKFSKHIKDYLKLFCEFLLPYFLIPISFYVYSILKTKLCLSPFNLYFSASATVLLFSIPLMFLTIRLKKVVENG